MTVSADRVLAFDSETKSFSWWDPTMGAFLFTWADVGGEYHAAVADPEAMSRFMHALDEADTVIGHNLKFDLHMLRAATGRDLTLENKRLEDTDLMARVLIPEGQNKGARGGFGLKNLATVYLRVDAKDPEEAIKAMGKKIGLRTIKKTGAYHDVWRAYPTEMETYARADARYTRDLYDVFLKRAAQEPRQAEIYEMERKVLPILLEAERVGIKTDQAQVAKFKREFTAERNTHYESLVTQLGERAMTPKDEWDENWEEGPEGLAEALQKLGVPLHERTKTGKLSTAKFALQEFESDFPVISELFEFRKLERFLNTYIGPMYGVDVIHPNFGQCGAWTGRMSCRTPNMQNWPKRAGKEVRSVLVPRPGHCFVVCDYEGIEERLLAWYLGDPWYRELAATRDPHAWLAAQIWGGEPSEYEKGTDKAITHRQPAKNIKFAITYGAGRKRVAAMLRDAGMPSSEEDAKQFISKIKASLPNYYFLTKHRIEPKIKSVGYVNTIAGRKAPVKRDKAYVGLNALIQGSAADIFKLGIIAVNDVVRPLGATPLLFVHDECVVECPLEYADECLTRMESAMCGAWDLTPPLSVEGSIARGSYADA